jgi:hypothetical protein
MAGDWTAAADVTSPRAKRALAWGDTMSAVANGTAQGWDLLLPMIDADRFVRRGNEREELAWPEYRKLLDQWVEHNGDYQKALRRISEVGNVVYMDFDEWPTAKDGSCNPLRSISIYEFDEADRIVAVDVCMGFLQPQ